MKKVLVLLVVLGLAGSAYAVDNTTLSDGNWNNPAIWSLGHEPNLSETAVVKNGKTITVTSAVTICERMKVGNQTDATLNIYDGADLYAVHGVYFAYGGSPTTNVNMYGGSFADMGKPGDPGAGGGWTMWGSSGTLNWYQSGGTATFFVNYGYGPVDCDVVDDGELNLFYKPITKDSTYYQDYYAANGGKITFGDLQATGNTGLHKFTIDVCGTMVVQTDDLTYFEARATYLGTPEYTVVGDNTEIHVVPEPATIALLGIGSLLMIRKRR
jgi:hypothetical protein